uniref:Uncharacterized protein n=1 Tax=Panagrolaimus davidi TaxID=227884 RepID=A0A914PL16_9BILA
MLFDDEEINGITGDSKVIRCLYMHFKLEKEYRRTRILNRFWWFFLQALKQCFSQIDSLEMGDVRKSYMNWIRWNMVEIITKLENFLTIPELDENYDAFVCMIQKIRNFEKNYFQLSEAEKGAINEYFHTINLIKERERTFNKNINIRVFQKAGNLLIHHLSYLVNRCYINRFDRPSYSMEQLKDDVEYLVNALKPTDTQLASEIENKLKCFQNFATLDESDSYGQEESMQKALELVEIQTKQPVLEKILEQIKKIRKQAGKKLGKILIKYVMLPIKNNPKTFAFTIIASLVIAALLGGPLGVVVGTLLVSEAVIIGNAIVLTFICGLLVYELEKVKKRQRDNKNHNNNNDANIAHNINSENVDNEDGDNDINFDIFVKNINENIQNFQQNFESELLINEEDESENADNIPENYNKALDEAKEIVEKEIRKVKIQKWSCQKQMLKIQRENNILNEAKNITQNRMKPTKSLLTAEK